MSIRLLQNLKTIQVSGLRGEPVRVRPASIAMMKPEKDCTLIFIINGASLRVKESPEEISAMIAKDCANLTRKAFAYSSLLEILEDGDDPFEVISEDRTYRIEALKSMAFSTRKFFLPRLFAIYRDIFSRFNIFGFFSSFSRPNDELSNYEKELYLKTEELKNESRKKL